MTSTRASRYKVTLSLNEPNYLRVKALLARLPGRPTVSGVVDQLLEQFLESIGPLVDASEGDQAELLRRLTDFHSSTVVEFSDAYRDTRDSIVRTKQGEEPREE